VNVLGRLKLNLKFVLVHDLRLSSNYRQFIDFCYILRIIFNIESLISKKIYFCICFRKPNVLHHENNDTCFQSCIIIWWSCIYTLYTHCVCTTVCNIHTHYIHIAGTDLGFQVRGAHLKKLRRVEGGAKIFGVCRVKNHDFTPKNHIFSNFRGARAGCSPPWIRPCIVYVQLFVSCLVSWKSRITTKHEALAVSLRDAKRRVVIRLFQLTRHDTNSCTCILCI
jgi:hypothetical protein